MAKHKKKIIQHAAARLLICVMATMALLFSSCKKKEIPQAKPKGGNTFSLSSTSFTDGDVIPQKYGKPNHMFPNNMFNDESEYSNVSPQLSWKNAPEGTTSFLIIMEKSLDDSESDYWCHNYYNPSWWHVYNIPASKTSLKEGDNSIYRNSNNYHGPKASIGEINVCQITIYALDLPADYFDHKDNFPPSSNAEAEQQLNGHILAKASITGTFIGK